MVKMSKQTLRKNLLIICFMSILTFLSFNLNGTALFLQPGESKENPIIISSKTDFESFKDEINSGNDFKGQYIKLSNDINLNSNEKIKGSIINWESAGYCIFNGDKKISKDSKAFQGYFDGNGYTINCNINLEKNNAKGLSLFGYIGENAKIENLNVSGYIKSTANNKILAGICDVNYGTLENCNVKAKEIYNKYGVCGICNANYGTIKNCEFKGKLTSKDLICCGICGINYKDIENCKTFALLNNCTDKGIKGNNEFKMPETAGITSYNYGKISECYVNAYILNSNVDISNGIDYYRKRVYNQPTLHDGCAGGIVSRNNGLVEKCNFKGYINGYQIGGICAANYETLDNCSTDCTLSGLIIGGISAQNIVGDKKISSPYVAKLPGGYIKDCKTSGEINTLYLAGDIVCLDFWNDSHSTILDCSSSSKINYLKN